VGTPFGFLLDPSSLFDPAYIALSPDGTRVYAFVWMGGSPGLSFRLLVVGIEDDTSSFTTLLERYLPASNLANQSDRERVAVTLSRAGRVLYFTFYPDQIWVMDTQTFDLTAIPWGETGWFAPRLLAASAGTPNVIYSSQGAALTKVTVTPWPFALPAG